MSTRRASSWALVLAGTFGAVMASSSSRAADGAALYAQECADCHGERGEGMGDFPPLAGTHAADNPEYLATFIRKGAGDMPAYPDLTADELASLVQFVQESLGQAGTPAKAAPPVPPGDPERGRDYFTGRQRLAAGGAPCLACHVAGSHGAVSGGMLGRDLTDAVQRYKGAAGVFGALKSFPFPVMRASYAGKALTEQERADLTAFFQGLGDAKAPPTAWADRFWLPAAAGAVLLFAVVAVIGSRRGPSPARRLRQSRS